jgi:hypothetical protein
MPTKTTKKPAKTTAKKAAKPAAIKAKTAAAKPAMKMAHSQNPTHGHKTGFMWKLLEQKEQALKKAQEGEHKNSANPNPHGFQPHDRDKSFSKFQGPRRKIG